MKTKDVKSKTFTTLPANNLLINLHLNTASNTLFQFIKKTAKLRILFIHNHHHIHHQNNYNDLDLIHPFSTHIIMINAKINSISTTTITPNPGRSNFSALLNRNSSVYLAYKHLRRQNPFHNGIIHRERQKKKKKNDSERRKHTHPWYKNPHHLVPYLVCILCSGSVLLYGIYNSIQHTPKMYCI